MKKGGRLCTAIPRASSYNFFSTYTFFASFNLLQLLCFDFQQLETICCNYMLLKGLLPFL